MKPTLLILAAGIGSRYGGAKQVDAFGPNGETIMDYSMYDAIRAGFGKIVFIINETIEPLFEEMFGTILKGRIDYDYVVQRPTNYLPADMGTVERTKPWGTAHALLCGWEKIDTPFTVINADDFYGREAFEKIARFLEQDRDASANAMVAYELSRTLSAYGRVARGVCQVDASGYLETVTERTSIARDEQGVFYEENGQKHYLPADSPVSMNFWGFQPSVFPIAKTLFEEYARKHFDAPKSEFYLPVLMTHLMQTGQGTCQVFRSSSDWFGVTYREDKPLVQAALLRQIEAGNYPEKLWT